MQGICPHRHYYMGAGIGCKGSGVCPSASLSRGCFGGADPGRKRRPFNAIYPSDRLVTRKVTVQLSVDFNSVSLVTEWKVIISSICGMTIVRVD